MEKEKMIAEMEQRRALLLQDFEKTKADLHAIEGAIQENEYWLNKLKAGDGDGGSSDAG